MKTITTFVLLLISTITFSQSFDDIIEVSSGGEARIDTFSQHYINAKIAGIEFIEFNTSGCDDLYGNDKIPTKMIKHELDNDTLTVVFEFSDACCISFLGDIEFIDSHLNLKYSAYGEPCECRCYYTLEYKFKTIEKINSISFKNEQLTINIEEY